MGGHGLVVFSVAATAPESGLAPAPPGLALPWKSTPRAVSWGAVRAGREESSRPRPRAVLQGGRGRAVCKAQGRGWQGQRPGSRLEAEC